MKHLFNILVVLGCGLTAWLYLEPLGSRTMDFTVLDGRWYSHTDICQTDKPKDLTKLRVVAVDKGVFNYFGMDSEPGDAKVIEQNENTKSELCKERVDEVVDFQVFGNNAKLYQSPNTQGYFLTLKINDKTLLFKKQTSES